MNTTIKRLITFLVSAVLLAAVLGVTASASGEAEFILPDEVKAGNDFSVSVRISTEKDIGLVSATLTYDDNILEFKASDNATGGSGVVNLKGFPDEVSSELTFKLNFRAKKNGDCSMNLTNCFVTSPEGDQLGSPSAAAFITVAENPDYNGEASSSDTDKDMADRGYLKSLTVSEGVLKPEFAYDIYDYRVDVDAEVDRCEIEGVTANDTDMIWYTGNEELAVGDNMRTIKVTDKDGYSHVYTITITRAMPVESSQQIVESVGEESVDQPEQSLSSVSGSSIPDIIEEEVDAFDKYRDIITPALIVILVALIIALVVIVVWLRKKTTGNTRKKR